MTQLQLIQTVVNAPACDRFALLLDGIKALGLPTDQLDGEVVALLVEEGAEALKLIAALKDNVEAKQALIEMPEPEPATVRLIGILDDAPDTLAAHPFD